MVQVSSDGYSSDFSRGLTPENVTEAIETTHAYAVDVSGGVESAKGIKDQQLIQRFMQGVQRGSAKR